MKDFLDKLSAERCADFKFSNVMDVSHVFDSHPLDESKLYFTRFNRIPNRVRLIDIDCLKANEWLLRHYQDEFKDCCFTKINAKPQRSRRYLGKGEEVYFWDVYHFMFDDLLVYIDHNESEVKILYRKTDTALVDKVVDEIRKFKKRKTYTRRKPEIELLLTDSSGGLSATSMSISKPKFSIEENYNDDFLPVHQTILSRLRTKNDKGLVLLHGKPGTGKTSYIRYLITNTNKSVIFLPPNMAASVTDP